MNIHIEKIINEVSHRKEEYIFGICFVIVIWFTNIDDVSQQAEIFTIDGMISGILFKLRKIEEILVKK